MEIKVKITKLLDKKTVVSKKDGSAYNVYNVVGTTTDDQFPKDLCFEIFGDDKFAQMNPQVGKEYMVSFDIECREWNGNNYTKLKAWKMTDMGVEATNVAPSVAPTIPAPQVPQPPQQQVSDLPF